MEEIIIIFIVLIIGVYLGWYLREAWAVRQVSHLLAQHEEQEEAEEEENRIRIFVEKHDGQYFAYEYPNAKFMAMGNTIEELRDALINNFPGEAFEIVT